MAQPDYAYRQTNMSNGPWNPSHSTFFTPETYQSSAYDSAYVRPPSVTYNNGTSSTYNLPAGTSTAGRSESTFSPSPPQTDRLASPFGGASTGYGANSMPYAATGAVNYGPTSAYGPYRTSANPGQGWEYPSRFSPSDSMDDIIGPASLSDEYSVENGGSGGGGGGGGGRVNGHGGPSSKSKSGSGNMHGGHGSGNGGNGDRKGRPNHRRPSNRDEFDGPHQFLAKPSPEYIARQERELPHLPTNLLVQEQDSVLSQVNDRLSLCAFDFVAKYQFPIPLTQDMRPVERPQDREWTEWVYLLKRLATKRRIPARVLYNGQIKQFVTILENSLEMRHASKHQSRPLKDDRNILQLISAGIQVAKILKDANAMEYLDKLYVATEQQIQERTKAAKNKFRSPMGSA